MTLGCTKMDEIAASDIASSRIDLERLARNPSVCSFTSRGRAAISDAGGRDAIGQPLVATGSVPMPRALPDRAEHMILEIADFSGEPCIA